MRVVVWNIGKKGGGTPDGARVLDACKKWSADIYLLQEVDAKAWDWWPPLPAQNQPLLLKNGLQIFAAYGPTMKWPWPRGGTRGNLILSRWPILEWWNYTYPLRRLRPAQSSSPANSIVWARLEHPHRPIHALSVHYSLEGAEDWLFPHNMANRVADARMIITILDARAPARDAVILGGDFNQSTPNIEADPSFPESENVDVMRGRLVDPLPDGIDHALFSTAPDSRTGFTLGPAGEDADSFQITEDHSLRWYDVEIAGPREPAACASMRSARVAILAEIDKQRRRLKGLTPKDPDYADIKEAVEEAVAKKQAELANLEQRAQAAGCDPLSMTPTNAPWP